MTAKVTRRTALIAISTIAAMPAGAQSPKAPAQPATDVVVLEKPATFEMDQKSAQLKESVQKEQQLSWRRKENPRERTIEISTMSVTLQRGDVAGKIKMSFSASITSHGFVPAQDIPLSIIARSRGGGALHSWTLAIPVKCTDRNQTLSPQTHDTPDDIGPNVFTNASTIEISEATGSNFPGVRLQRCRA